MFFFKALVWCALVRMEVFAGESIVWAMRQHFFHWLTKALGDALKDGSYKRIPIPTIASSLWRTPKQLRSAKKGK